jgi:phosphoribosylamine---glycine ligase
MNTPQNILIIGAGGGREHTLAWKLAQSPKLGRLYITPGNGGTAGIATTVDVDPLDQAGLVAFARTHGINLTIVAADDPLAAGVVDAFRAARLCVFGPTKAAARIEWSKAFSKDLMARHHIPTARYQTFTDIAKAKAYTANQPYPLVIKASGLALGKGVYICADINEANQALDEIMGQKVFGGSGDEVVIEEFLRGQEVSIQVLCDGHTSVILPVSQDHKAIGAGDVGPNTGGMGAYAPVSWMTPELLERVRTQVVEPVLAGLAAAEAPFTGLLFPGLMITPAGEIKVLEFNARFGDPEPQSYLRLLKTDFLDVLNAAVDGQLAGLKLEWSSDTAVCVVMASGGYPGKYQKGLPITGLDAAAKLPGVVIFHAGTRLAPGADPKTGPYVTSGGRVLGVSAVGRDLAEARDRAYAAAKLIHFDGAQYRTDIGLRPSPLAGSTPATHS